MLNTIQTQEEIDLFGLPDFEDRPEMEDINDIINTHPHSDFRSYVCIGILYKGKMTEKYIMKNSLPQYLDNFQFSKTCDYYITANTFKVIRKKRSLDNLFSLENIVIDIDFHGRNMTAEEYRQAGELVGCMGLPVLPTQIVATGRGFQLWFNFEETALALSGLYDSCTNRLLALIKKRLAELLEQTEHSPFYKNGSPLRGYQVDTTASRNKAGFFRLSGSINQKNGRQAEGRQIVDIDHPQTYTLQELLEALPEAPEEAQRRAEAKAKAEQIKLDRAEIKALKAQTGADYRANRLRFIRYLIKTRQTVEGSRDKFLFIYYNYSKQIYGGNTAKKLIETINAQFTSPLEYRELKKIFSYIDRKGFLRFRNDTFLEFLECSPKEIKTFTAGFSLQNQDREVAKMKKEERDKAIIAMRKNGKTNLEIADSLGIAAKTVYNVLKKHPLEDNRKEQIQKYRAEGLQVMTICQMLGISKQTYYNILKKGEVKQ